MLKGTIYLRPMLLKWIETMKAQLNYMKNTIPKALAHFVWKVYSWDAIFGSNLDNDSFMEWCGISGKPNREKSLEEKSSCFYWFYLDFNIIEPLRYNDNQTSWAAGSIFNPIILSCNPSWIDYILVSESLICQFDQIEVKVGPCADVNSDHDYTEMNLYIWKQINPGVMEGFFLFLHYLLIKETLCYWLKTKS